MPVFDKSVRYILKLIFFQQPTGTIWFLSKAAAYMTLGLQEKMRVFADFAEAGLYRILLLDRLRDGFSQFPLFCFQSLSQMTSLN